MMSGGEAAEEESRTLATDDSSVLPALEVAEYTPAEAPHSLDTAEKRTWEDQARFLYDT